MTNNLRRHSAARAVLLTALPGLGFLVLTAAHAGGAKPTVPAEAVDYNRDIRPILASNCFACHGQDPESRQAGLRLDVREGAVALRNGSRAIDPGKPEKSSLVARINAADPDLLMPPASSGHQLTPQQKKLLTVWVEQGAPYAVHWSFAPLRRPAVPKVKNRSWSRTSLDPFVLARLEKAGLKPAADADRYTLIRRVSLDLTGLPPTPSEVEAFVQDRSPNAYEKVVDRLLASPRYGEHWARMWLDLARYADTQGYEKDGQRTIWRYRDWVIDALNADMPYDRFTLEQLAGDLLPNPTPSQILATAFHRNTMTNTEGGVDREEFRIAAVKDRVDTTVQVWMGLTMGCAKCHTHKYDPITQREYYRFFALFNQTEDANRSDEAPTVPMPTPEQKGRLAELDDKIRTLRAAFAQDAPELEAQQLAWEKELAAKSLWTPLRFERAESAAGASFHSRPDGALVVGGPKLEKDTYTLTFPLPPITVRSLRLEALKDPSLPSGGPGRHTSDQNVVTSELTLEFIAEDGQERKPVALVNPRADFEQQGWPVGGAIDRKPETGWAWSPQNGKAHVAVFDLKAPLASPGGHLVATLKQNYPHLQHGCFRLSVSGSEPALLKAELQPLSDLARVPRAQRSEKAQKRLDEAFRQTHEPTAGIYREITATEKERSALEAAIPKTPIMRELPRDKQRLTRIHQRGNFLDPGEEVAPGFPTAFGPVPAGAPPNRLGAAQWLVSPENPLTARVAVNRLWARLFGTGLVETEEDFGTQGSLPSHPELLDHLASLYSTPAAVTLKQGSEGAGSQGERSHIGQDGYGLTGGKGAGGPGERESHPSRTAAASDSRGSAYAIRNTQYTDSSQYALRITHYAGKALRNTQYAGTSPLAPQPSHLPQGLGWSTKQLLKMIVMSATYRQAAQSTPEKLKADPTNALLSRGPRFRLPAEVIRDQALAVSGLLSAKTHGPSVMPPQPDGIWKTVYSGLKWKTSEGDDRYRRSLYTFWRRTSPYPSLTTFDAGSGEFCVVRRIRTNTPLQALVTLNDPAYVEAAGALGRTMLKGKATKTRDRLLAGYYRTLARKPAAPELDRLVRLFDTTLADFRAKPEAAKALLAAASAQPLKDHDTATYAAYLVVANVLLNLDEALTKP